MTMAPYGAVVILLWKRSFVIHRQKGFLVAVPHGQKVSYKPENPAKLKERVEAMRRAVESSLPALTALFEKQHMQPKIIFYDTKDGIHRLYEEIFRSKEIWSIFSPDRFYEVFTKEELFHYLRILEREGGTLYDIVENTKGAISHATEPKYYAVSKVRFLPKGKRIATDTLVAGDKVAFVSFETLIGVIIEDRNIAATMRLMLQSLFEQSEPLETY